MVALCASWSDAPVQTFAAALFLRRDQIHFMHDLGYSYSVGLQCPADSLVAAELQCICDPSQIFREYTSLLFTRNNAIFYTDIKVYPRSIAALPVPVIS